MKAATCEKGGEVNYLTGDYVFVGERNGARIYRVELGSPGTCQGCGRERAVMYEWATMRRARVAQHGVFCSYLCWPAKPERESLLLDRIPRWLAWSVLLLGAFIAGRLVS